VSVGSKAGVSGPVARAPGPDPWDQADRIAQVLAVDPAGLGGVVVRGGAGAHRDEWLARMVTLLPDGAPLRRVPAGVGADRLIGGLDLVATLANQRASVQRGLLAEADGGVLLISMAERIEPGTALAVAAAMDTRNARVERDGVSAGEATRFMVVAMDESDMAEGSTVPAALRDRLALEVVPPPMRIGSPARPAPDYAAAAAARALLPRVRIDEPSLTALCEAAAAMGIQSLRPPIFAARVACTIAALDGCEHVNEETVLLAARMVLGHHALAVPEQTVEPAPGDSEPDASTADRERGEGSGSDGSGETSNGEGALAERVVAAVAAIIPAEARSMPADARSRGAEGSGRAAATIRSLAHGRPVGTRPGVPSGGARLAVLDSVRAAAPWQRLRGRTESSPTLVVTPEDLRVRVLARDARVTTIFVVDASGSSALHRMSEAKGAVELMLADSYVRRDRVALIAFRRQRAELLLAPTRSLARARRALAELPGGGGTPLASALDAARQMVGSVRRTEEQARVVLLTDGRANVSRDGSGGRTQAARDALAAARALATLDVPALLIDTAPPRPGADRNGEAASIAEAMGARFLALPLARSAAIHAAITASLPSAA
jgi:magnesium chelatase subunit D